MRKLSDEASVVMRTVRAATAPTSRDRERVRQAVERQIAMGAPPALPLEGPFAKLSLGWITAAVGTAAVVASLAVDPSAPVAPASAARFESGAVAASVSAIVSADMPPSAPSADETTSARAADPSRSPILAPIPSIPARPPASRARSFEGKPPRVRPRDEGTLSEELAVLREAHRALARGEPSASIEKIRELGSRHPNGVLVEERRAAEVLALCAAGRREEAQLAGSRFLAEFPASVHTPRIRDACAAR